MELTQEYFDEKLNGLATKQDLNGLTVKVDGMGARLDGMATKLDGIETRLDGLTTKEDFDGLTVKVDGMEARMATKDDLDVLTAKVDALPTKKDVESGYEELARIVAEGFRGTDEYARENREALVKLEGKMDQLVGTVKEVAEMHRESMEAIKELSVGHHNHEVRITRLEGEDRHGFQARTA